MFGGGGTSPSIPCAEGVDGLDASAMTSPDPRSIHAASRPARRALPPQRAAVDFHPLALPLAFVDLVVQRLIAAGCDPDLDSAVDTVCLHGHHGVLRVGGRSNGLDLLPRIPSADPGFLRVRGLPAR